MNYARNTVLLVALTALFIGIRWLISGVTTRKNLATAHLFIGNPLPGRSLRSLFSTHPSLENRVTRLRQMAEEAKVTAQ